MNYFDLILSGVMVVMAVFNLLRKNVPKRYAGRVEAKDVRNYNRLNALCYLCFGGGLGIVWSLGTPTPAVRSSSAYMCAFLIAFAGVLCRLMNDALHLNKKIDKK